MLSKLHGKFQLLLLILYKKWVFNRIQKFAAEHQRKRSEIRKIAAYWYNPTNIPGSTERIGGWKKYFEAEGFTYTNFTTITNEERVEQYEKGSWADRYKLLRKIYAIRFQQFKQLTDYDVVWIDRGFIPYDYDLKNAFFEQAIKKMGLRIVIDSTDGGDYKRNPALVKDTILQADAVTTGFNYIREMFTQLVSVPVIQVNYTLPVTGYIEKKDYSLSSKPVLGWMGSPSNMAFLKSIKPPLQAVAKKHPFKLIVICRSPLELNIPNAEIEYKKSFDNYHETLARFDIGLCPFTREDESTKGKIAMKHQEFMICKIPQVCSPVAICDEIEDGKHALIARSIPDWEGALIRMIEDEALRQKCGNTSNQLFHALFAYEAEYPKLKSVISGQ